MSPFVSARGRARLAQRWLRGSANWRRPSSASPGVLVRTPKPQEKLRTARATL